MSPLFGPVYLPTDHMSLPHFVTYNVPMWAWPKRYKLLYITPSKICFIHLITIINPSESLLLNQLLATVWGLITTITPGEILLVNQPLVGLPSGSFW